MLKSLLGYQSGMGGGASETVLRKKVYETAVNNTMKNNFPFVVKVRAYSQAGQCTALVRYTCCDVMFGL